MPNALRFTAPLALLYRHALRRRALIGLDAREIVATRMHVALWTALASIATLSTLCATLVPRHAEEPFVFTAPGMVYALVGIVTPLVRRHYAQQMPALQVSA